MKVFLSICASFILLKSCNKNSVKNSDLDGRTALDSFVIGLKYLPFDMPRNGAGCGTLIRFNKGIEDIVATKNECFQTLSVDTFDVFIPNVDLSKGRENSFSAKVPKALAKVFNLGLSYSNDKIRSISIKLSRPFEARSSILAVKNAISNLPSSNSQCAELLADSSNILLLSVLGARSLEVTLNNLDSSEVQLSPSFLDSISINSKFKRSTSKKNTLIYQNMILLGWRPYRAKLSNSLEGIHVELSELNEQQVLKMKRKSK